MATETKAATHTPGPWLVEGRLVYALHEHRNPESGRVVKCNRFSAYVEAWVSQGGLETEADANVSLIAAAPDLLEAAHRALAQLTGGFPGDPRDQQWFPNTDVVHGLANAIAKAEGR